MLVGMCVCVCVAWPCYGLDLAASPPQENRKELKVKAEDCIGQHQLSHPGPPIGRLINKVLSHERERCRMMEHNTLAMVIDPLLYAWVSVYSFRRQLIFF